MDLDQQRLVRISAGHRLSLIAASFRRLTGRDLVAAGDDLAGALWTAPRAVVAHGIQATPVFFYGNRLALDLFQTTAQAFVRTPSAHSAEPAHRDERARLLEAVSRQGFIDDYSGVRISAAGRRFRIQRAVVWNLMDEAGGLHGQAATFSDWTWLDEPAGER